MNDYRFGSYLRLSKEDENKQYKRENESESIINQRSLIINYTKDNNFNLIKEYVDDGYSGTTFDDRPAFQRMLSDIENGVINAVITKDLSRLGRDYIQSGYYLEKYFPLKKVRYVSILDNIDTFLDNASNDIAPFKALFNDMTSKDTSKKIRAILKDKKRKGLFLGSEAPYGYLKDPANKHHLIPNSETSITVKRIFSLALSGKGLTDIAAILNNEGIKTPLAYKKRKQVYIWTNSTVNHILNNRVYTGDLVQNVQNKLNYKSKKKIILDKKDWITVKNTHEPLITKEEYNIIQNSPNRRRKPIKRREKLLFENLIYCKECGSTLGVHYNKRQNSWSLNCNKYSRSPRLKLCCPHFIPYNKFEEAVLNKVKETFKKHYKEIDINKIIDKLNKSNNNTIKEKQTMQNKINELNYKTDLLYNDRLNNIISLDIYIKLSSEVQKEINILKQKLNNKKENNTIDYKSIIFNLVNIDNPSRELLFYFIKKIEVDRNRIILIYYYFQ